MRTGGSGTRTDARAIMGTRGLRASGAQDSTASALRPSEDRCWPRCRRFEPQQHRQGSLRRLRWRLRASAASQYAGGGAAATWACVLAASRRHRLSESRDLLLGRSTNVRLQRLLRYFQINLIQLYIVPWSVWRQRELEVASLLAGARVNIIVRPCAYMLARLTAFEKPPTSVDGINGLSV